MKFSTPKLLILNRAIESYKNSNARFLERRVPDLETEFNEIKRNLIDKYKGQHERRKETDSF